MGDPAEKCLASVIESILESVAEPERSLRFASESACIEIIYEMKIPFSDTYGSISYQDNSIIIILNQ